MKFRQVILAAILLSLPLAAWAEGNPKAGEEVVMNSCSTCHAPSGTTVASDAAPPLSSISRDQKHQPDWIHAWLLQPHRAIAGIMLSRQQIDDVMACLSTVATG